MRGALPRLFVLATLLTWGPLALMSACGGSSFQSDGGDGTGASPGAGSGGSSQAGSVSTGGGKSACGGPEDCDDDDVCTSDICTVEGSCAAAPKCTLPSKCCEGDCAECCEDADCDDGVGCTVNTCFAGQCMYLPDDAACGESEFCSVTESCRPKIACGPNLPEVTCQDASACTTDACVDGFCKNTFCDQGALCCSTGCAEECCDDSQCDDTNDPCMVGSCQGGVCNKVPLCADGEQCCPSPDGSSASCGSCCSAAECDDGVSCTADSCTGARRSCNNNPDNTKCASTEICNPEQGCVPRVDCDDAGDCTQGPCGRCAEGACKYDCPNNQPCCATTGQCAACCGDASCNDGIGCTVDKCTAGGCTRTPDPSLCPFGYQCHPQLGGCVQCTADADCDDGEACTVDSCNLQTHTCTRINKCGCKANYECLGQVVCAGPAGGAQGDAAIPIGSYCHACIDGQCGCTPCYGSCCTSGCYMGLCPD
jgi:hypothetical protein